MWNKNKILELYELPFNDLIHKAHLTHRENFNVNQVQVSTLLSIKTGSCPENCKYCPQSAHYNTNIEKTPLYKRNRLTEYNSFSEQLDMIYWDKKNGTNIWESHIDVIKNKYPKS